MTSRSFFRGLFWSLIALAVLFYAAGGWYFSSELIDDAFVIDADPLTVSTGDFQLEEVEYQTELGAMDAWYLPAAGETWVIHVHGLGTTPAEAEPMFAPLQEAGYPQLAITYRNDDGQPEDPSGYYQYGVTEYKDVSAAISYALENGAEQIFVNSYSTGAAHTLGFMFREQRDRVVGAHFDSPNINFGETVNFNAAQRELPLLGLPLPASLAEVAKFITSLRIGVSWGSLDYVDTASTSLNAPVLVHHGTADMTVPISTSLDFADARPEFVRLIQVEGADHVGSYDVDPEKYVDEVLTFLQSVD
ncbi:MAG TPA: alpha/beta hydrolase [Acidimicrobiia bacterium]